MVWDLVDWIDRCRAIDLRNRCFADRNCFPRKPHPSPSSPHCPHLYSQPLPRRDAQARHYPHSKTIYLPLPTWGNHIPISKDSGLEVKHYRYFDKETVGLDFEGMKEDLKVSKGWMEEKGRSNLGADETVGWGCRKSRTSQLSCSMRESMSKTPPNFDC